MIKLSRIQLRLKAQIKIRTIFCKVSLDNNDVLIFTALDTKTLTEIEKTLKEFPPWVTQETKETFAKSVRAYFHNEIIDYMNWI